MFTLSDFRNSGVQSQENGAQTYGQATGQEKLTAMGRGLPKGMVRSRTFSLTEGPS